MEFQIRNAEPKDAETIASFQIAMALETENKVLEQEIVERAVAKVFSDPVKGFYLVATGVAAELGDSDGSKEGADGETEVLGSLMITYEWSDWRDANIWYIQSVYVDKRVRGQGIFRAMYRRVIELAREKNVMFVRLYVETDNHRAQNVYESLGMKRMPYFMYDINLRKEEAKLSFDEPLSKS